MTIATGGLGMDIMGDPMATAVQGMATTGVPDTATAAQDMAITGVPDTATAVQDMATTGVPATGVPATGVPATAVQGMATTGVPDTTMVALGMSGVYLATRQNDGALHRVRVHNAVTKPHHRFPVATSHFTTKVHRQITGVNHGIRVRLPDTVLIQSTRVHRPITEGKH
jgi:hypothetical protein